MKNVIRLTEYQLNDVVTKILKEQYELPSYKNPYNFDYSPKLLHVNNVCSKNNVKGCTQDGVYTNFDKDYDYKLSKGVWYTKQKGSMDWIDLTNHPNQNIRRKSLEILNQKIANVKKGGQVVKKDDKIIKKDDKIVKKDSNYNCIAISKEECSKISPTQDTILSSKHKETRCSAYMHKCLSQFDSQLSSGNAWSVFVNNKGLGPIKYNMYSDGTVNWNQIYKDVKINKLNNKKCDNLTYDESDKQDKSGANVVEKSMPMKSGVNLKSLELGDMVGIYLHTSPNKGYAFCERALGRKLDDKGNMLDKDPFTYNTHVGFVGAIKNGVPIIIHNIHGTHHATPATKLLSKTGKGMITWVLGDNNIKQSIASQKTKNLQSQEISEHFKSVYEKKILVEQKPDNLMPGQNDNSYNIYKNTQNSQAENIKYKRYSCIPEPGFRPVVGKLISEGYDKKFLKAALGVIGRESSYGSGFRYNITKDLKAVASFFGVNTSVGPAQMKQSTAEDLNLKDSILSLRGALIGVYKLLKNNYKKAVSEGYSTNQPTVNFNEGSGDAALDIAIAAYNIGVGRITKYCMTNDPNIKRPCSKAGQIVENNNGNSKKYKVTNNVAKNYLPNFKTQRWDKVNISTHGYVKEVVEKMESFNCF